MCPARSASASRGSTSRGARSHPPTASRSRSTTTARREAADSPCSPARPSCTTSRKRSGSCWWTKCVGAGRSTRGTTSRATGASSRRARWVTCTGSSGATNSRACASVRSRQLPVPPSPALAARRACAQLGPCHACASSPRTISTERWSRDPMPPAGCVAERPILPPASRANARAACRPPARRCCSTAATSSRGRQRRISRSAALSWRCSTRWDTRRRRSAITSSIGGRTPCARACARRGTRCSRPTSAMPMAATFHGSGTTRSSRAARSRSAWSASRRR